MFASQDPVAVESMLFDLFQFDKDTDKYHAIAGAQDYLVEAAQANSPPSGTYYDPDHASNTTRLPSLGVFEHWNNAIDRKYSRNLSSAGTGIELVFINGATSKIRMTGPVIQKDAIYSLRMLSGSSQVELSIPRSGQVKLTVYDCRGRTERTVINQFLNSGIYHVDAFPASAGGKTISAGYYIYNLYCKESSSLKPVSLSGKITFLR
jgi:hypothetical protein